MWNDSTDTYHYPEIGPDYSQIVPQQFELTIDPAVAGFERIPNVQERVRLLLKRFKKEAEEADAVETSEEVKKGVRTHSAKLSATLCGGRLALPSRPLAYRLTCVNGRQYLLGTADPPFPLTTQEEKRPGNAAETSAVALVFSLNSSYPVLKFL